MYRIVIFYKNVSITLIVVISQTQCSEILRIFLEIIVVFPHIFIVIYFSSLLYQVYIRKHESKRVISSDVYPNFQYPNHIFICMLICGELIVYNNKLVDDVTLDSESHI